MPKDFPRVTYALQILHGNPVCPFLSLVKVSWSGNCPADVSAEGWGSSIGKRNTGRELALVTFVFWGYRAAVPCEQS